ncbi:hypothetical protein F5Y14DRAFT_421086 [Nemania sp. NC0429]|nr:hypothetical protein F5Y14DRAFT_421086 [Nemania sp. NC0429]
MDALTTEQYDEYQKTLLDHAKDVGIDATVKTYDPDVIMGAPTGRSTTIYDVASYHVGTVPLGYAKFDRGALELSFTVQ